MRKYGKYEKRRSRVPAKQPKAKSTILQTYFLSLLCLVLCAAMFFSTSYAWFTSEATYATNEIYVGTLSVGLYKGTQNFADGNTKLFDSSIPWQPGDTEYAAIKVVNEGTMDFKYELNFALPAAEETAAFMETAECFEVKVLKGEYTEAASYAELTAKNGWSDAVSLADLLKGKPVLNGELAAGSSQAASDPAEAEAEKPADTYTIALHMRENMEDPSVMGQKITFHVKLVAYQKGYVPAADGTDKGENANA